MRERGNQEGISRLHYIDSDFYLTFMLRACRDSSGMDGAVASLTRPVGPAVLTGASPTNGSGPPLDPINTFGDASTWWIDRMIRTDQPLELALMAYLTTRGRSF